MRPGHPCSTGELLPAALPLAEYPLNTMSYKGCTLEYWPKCMYQSTSFDFCKSRGGDLFSYIDGTDLATFYNFVSQQSAATRLQSLQCSGMGYLWPGLSALLWTGLRSASGSSSCGTSCTWQDMGTGENVTNVASIVPCYMVGDGNAIEFVIWDNTPNGPCLQGGSNDADGNAWLAHFICRVGCGEWCACLPAACVLVLDTSKWRSLCATGALRHGARGLLTSTQCRS